jgi:hypothetical protein
MDLMTFFLPWYTFLGDRLRDLAIPGWNPHLLSGAPFAGDPESGWMYLPAMLSFTLFPSAITAFKGMVVVQLAIAAVSTYLFARVLGMGALASLVAATVYLLGPFLHWNTHCCLIFSQFATWIPLALLGAELALRSSRWPDRVACGCLGGFAVSQMFAGWIGEGWLYAILLPGSYIAYRALISPWPGRSWPARVAIGVATGIGVLGSGLALGAAGILPRYAVNAEMNLAGGNYAQYGDAGVLNPPWTLTYLLQQTLGVGTGYHFRAAAIGGAAIVLSLLALLLGRQRFVAPYFAALTLIAMILTLDTTPLHQLFYLIPRFREFHEHDAWRTISLSAIGPAILSGAAIELLPRWRGRWPLLPVIVAPLLALSIAALVMGHAGLPLGWSPLLAAALTTALVAIVVAVGCPHPQPLSRLDGRGESVRREWLHMATPRDVSTPSPGSTGEGRGEGKSSPSGVSPPGSLSPNSGLVRLISILILVVIVVFPTGIELTGSWLGWPREGTLWQHLERDPSLDAALATEMSRSDPAGAGEFLRQQLARLGPFRYAGYGGFGYSGDGARPDPYMARRLDPFVQGLLTNGRPIFLGLDDVQGYNPLQLSRYVEFMAALNGQPQDYHTEFLTPSGARSPLLDLLDVRYLLVDASLPPERGDVAAPTAGLREVFRTPWVVVYERSSSLPHAWIVHDVRQVERGEALPLMASQAIDPFQTALVEGPPPAVAAPGDPSSETARVTTYQPDRLTIATHATATGFLVVSEIYASGWRAFVDGMEAPVVPTDHALRGIPLPAGDHSVELRYEPLSLQVGLAVSAIAAIAMLAAFAVAAWTHLSRYRTATRGESGASD